LIIGLFNDAVLTADVKGCIIKLNLELIVNGELARIWKEAVMDFLKVSSSQLTRGTEKNLRQDIW
jgi:hypothetical protein